MYLETWIHNKVRETFSQDPEYRRFMGKEALQAVTRQEIESLQLFRLRNIMGYASQKSPFYRDLAGIIAEIRSLDDLPKIPFTDPEDLAQSPYKLLCISMSQIARIFSHTTTGTTTGKLKKVFFTHKDADRIIDSMSAIMHTVLESAGMDVKGRVIQIFLPNNGPPFSIAGLIAKGAEKMGGVPVIGDCSADTEAQFRSIDEARPDMLMGSAFRIWRITQEASVSHDLSKVGVKTIFITSEYVSAPMRKRLEDCWGAEVFHHYGMTEPGFVIGVECSEHDGFHFNESDLLFEVVDPETGKILEGDEEGELVLTTLKREGMPLIRYRTGDVASLLHRPCRCGASTLIRIGTIFKRTALITEIGKQEKIYTSLIDENLYGIPDLVDYRLFITKENEIDFLTCKIEVLGNDNHIKEQVSGKLLAIPAIGKSFDSGLLAGPEVKIVDRGSLRRGGRSLKRRIADRR